MRIEQFQATQVVQRFHIVEFQAVCPEFAQVRHRINAAERQAVQVLPFQRGQIRQPRAADDLQFKGAIGLIPLQVLNAVQGRDPLYIFKRKRLDVQFRQSVQVFQSAAGDLQTVIDLWQSAQVDVLDVIQLQVGHCGILQGVRHVRVVVRFRINMQPAVPFMA